MKLTEIRQQGYKALIDSLGVVGMLRFLQQFEAGYGDYTTEKYQLDEPTLEEFKDFVKQKNNQKAKQGSWDKFKQVLDKVSEREPEDYDKL
jgi:hypothetical protein